MNRLIINADDFGKSQSINRAIDECMKKKYISSTTLMVNMPCAEGAVQLAFDGGYADKVGLHLNLTDGSPLSAAMRNNKRFVTDGVFNRKFHLNTISRFVMTRKDILCIRGELEEQIKKYVQMMGDYANMHVDSHHHIHTDYAVYRALEPLIDKYGIVSIRLTRTISKDGFGMMKKLYKIILNNRIKKETVFSTDEMGTFRDYYECLNKMNERLVTELECHPDYYGEAIVNICKDKEPIYRDFNLFFSSINEYQLVDWCMHKMASTNTRQ